MSLELSKIDILIIWKSYFFYQFRRFPLEDVYFFLKFNIVLDITEKYKYFIETATRDCEETGNLMENLLIADTVY